MAWGAESSPETLSNVTSTEVFFATVGALKTKEIARFRVNADFQTTPNNGLIIKVYPSNDGTNFALVSEITRFLDQDTDPNEVIIKVRDMPYFRVGVASDGGDTIPSVTGAVALDGGLSPT